MLGFINSFSHTIERADIDLQYFQQLTRLNAARDGYSARRRREEGWVAHLSFHAARVDPIATGNHPLLKNLVQNRLVEGVSLPRGE